MMNSEKPIVIKISGNYAENIEFLQELPDVLQELDAPVIIVHGGGQEISRLQVKLGIEPRYSEGVRVTDGKSLALVEMVLCGLVNKRIVHYLLAGGIDAMGLSGVDRSLILATRMQHTEIHMGYTGEIIEVRGEVLSDLLQQNITPVIAPVCYGEDSNYNVNADHVSGAIANAIQAQRVVFLTNVEGVLLNEMMLEELSPDDAEILIETGIIDGGMIPKVRTALELIHQGIPEVSITNLRGLRTHGGTIFRANIH